MISLGYGLIKLPEQLFFIRSIASNIKYSYFRIALLHNRMRYSAKTLQNSNSLINSCLRQVSPQSEKARRLVYIRKKLPNKRPDTEGMEEYGLGIFNWYITNALKKKVTLRNIALLNRIMKQQVQYYERINRSIYFHSLWIHYYINVKACLDSKASKKLMIFKRVRATSFAERKLKTIGISSLLIIRTHFLQVFILTNNLDPIWIFSINDNHYHLL